MISSLPKIRIEENNASSDFVSKDENGAMAVFYLNVENLDLKSICSIRTLFDIDRPVNDYRMFNTKESAAQYNAHVKAWKFIVDNNIRAALVEDQVCGGTNVELKEEPLPLLQGDLFLYDYDELPDIKDDTIRDTWKRIRNVFHGLKTYVITNQGARFLLRYAYPIEMRVDSFVGTVAHLYPKDFIVYALTESSLGKRDRTLEKTNKAKIRHLKTHSLETPFKHNHPRHLRPSNPMSNIPMLSCTIVFFLIFICIVLLVLNMSDSSSES